MSDPVKRKILVPLFNRAHYGRLRPVLTAIRNHPKLELQIMAAVPVAYSSFFLNLRNSSPRSWRKSLPWFIYARLMSFWNILNPGAIKRHDYLITNIEQDGFHVDTFVPMFFQGGNSETMSKSVGYALMRIADELKKLKPDFVFVNADRFEMMSVALAAVYSNIPIVHNEGGDVSGTIDESIRHAITKLAQVHFTSTERSRERVIQMGENPDLVFSVGSPAIDVIKDLDTSFPAELFPGFAADKYLLVLVHPVVTAGPEENRKMTQNIIRAIEELKMPTIILGSNVDAGSNAVSDTLLAWAETTMPGYVHLGKHLHPDIFYRVLANAVCSLGNSSSFIREGAYFGTPAVLVGRRQENRERAKNVVEVECDATAITRAVRDSLKHGRFERDMMFGTGDSGEKIADILSRVDPSVQKKFHDK